MDLFEGNSQGIVRENDRGLARTGAKIVDAFGPLAKLWAILDKAKQDDEGELDIEEMATLMEKSIVILGQATMLTLLQKGPNNGQIPAK